MSPTELRRRLSASPLLESRIGRLLLLWHGAALTLALIAGVVEGDAGLFCSLAIWTVIAAAAYLVRPPLFLVTGCVLVAAEETLVYVFGGGLQGRAVSLAHDFTMALPSMWAFVFGWWLALRHVHWPQGTLYAAAGLHGIVVELSPLNGVADPIFVFLLGGPAAFIYATFVLAPRPPAAPVHRRLTLVRGFILWAFVFFLMAMGAIAAHTLTRTLGTGPVAAPATAATRNYEAGEPGLAVRPEAAPPAATARASATGADSAA